MISTGKIILKIRFTLTGKAFEILCDGFPFSASFSASSKNNFLCFIEPTMTPSLFVRARLTFCEFGDFDFATFPDVYSDFLCIKG